MLVRDLENIMYDDEDIGITVYDKGFEIDWKFEIPLRQMVRDYGDYEILRIFSFIDSVNRSVISVMAETPSREQRTCWNANNEGRQSMTRKNDSNKAVSEYWRGYREAYYDVLFSGLSAIRECGAGYEGRHFRECGAGYEGRHFREGYSKRIEKLESELVDGLKRDLKDSSNGAF